MLDTVNVFDDDTSGGAADCRCAATYNDSDDDSDYVKHSSRFLSQSVRKRSPYTTETPRARSARAILVMLCGVWDTDLQ